MLAINFNFWFNGSDFQKKKRVGKGSVVLKVHKFYWIHIYNFTIWILKSQAGAKKIAKKVKIKKIIKIKIKINKGMDRMSRLFWLRNKKNNNLLRNNKKKMIVKMMNCRKFLLLENLLLRMKKNNMNVMLGIVLKRSLRKKFGFLWIFYWKNNMGT